MSHKCDWCGTSIESKPLKLWTFWYPLVLGFFKGLLFQKYFCSRKCKEDYKIKYRIKA